VSLFSSTHTDFIGDNQRKTTKLVQKLYEIEDQIKYVFNYMLPFMQDLFENDHLMREHTLSTHKHHISVGQDALIRKIAYHFMYVYEHMRIYMSLHFCVDPCMESSPHFYTHTHTGTCSISCSAGVARTSKAMRSRWIAVCTLKQSPRQTASSRTSMYMCVCICI
jgi:hypothetical protein